MEIQVGDYVRFTKSFIGYWNIYEGDEYEVISINMPYIRLKLKNDIEGDLIYSSIHPFAKDGAEIAAIWLGNSLDVKVDVSSLL